MEKASHIDAKIHFSQILRNCINRKLSLFSNINCSNLVHENDQEFLVVSFFDTDAVLIEERVDNFIPDILVKRCNSPILAVEILNSHKVDRFKKRFYREKEFTTIEILASTAVSIDLNKDLDLRKIKIEWILSKNRICQYCQETFYKKVTILKASKFTSKDFGALIAIEGNVEWEYFSLYSIDLESLVEIFNLKYPIEITHDWVKSLVGLSRELP